MAKFCCAFKATKAEMELPKAPKWASFRRHWWHQIRIGIGLSSLAGWGTTIGKIWKGLWARPWGKSNALKQLKSRGRHTKLNCKFFLKKNFVNNLNNLKCSLCRSQIRICMDGTSRMRCKIPMCQLSGRQRWFTFNGTVEDIWNRRKRIFLSNVPPAQHSNCASAASHSSWVNWESPGHCWSIGRPGKIESDLQKEQCLAGSENKKILRFIFF